MKLPVAAALIVGAAALTGGATLLHWASAVYTDELRGSVSVEATGADLAPALQPLAAAALAALGAILASRGALRRIVGGLVLMLGVAVGWIGFHGLVNQPIAELAPQAVNTGGSSVSVHATGPILAILAGLVLIRAGIGVITGVTTARALSARYERRATAATVAASNVDPALVMWKDLDEHRDPTLGGGDDDPHVTLTGPATGDR